MKRQAPAAKSQDEFNKLRKQKRYKDGDYARLAEAIMQVPEDSLILHWQKFLKPDRDRLDEQISELPYLFYQISDVYADAIDALRELEDRLAEVRKKAEAAAFAVDTGKKVTVAQAKANADGSPKVIKLMARIREAKKRVGKLDALREAFKQKASMLKATVELVASQYIQKDHIKPRTRRA